MLLVPFEIHDLDTACSNEHAAITNCVYCLRAECTAVVSCVSYIYLRVLRACWFLSELCVMYMYSFCELPVTEKWPFAFWKAHVRLTMFAPSSPVLGELLKLWTYACVMCCKYVAGDGRCIATARNYVWKQVINVEVSPLLYCLPPSVTSRIYPLQTFWTPHWRLLENFSKFTETHLSQVFVPRVLKYFKKIGIDLTASDSLPCSGPASCSCRLYVSFLMLS